MHPALCEKVSILSYEGRLDSDVSTTARTLRGVAPGLVTTTLRHRGNRTDSPEEADEVLRQVARVIGTPWLNPKDSPQPRPLGQQDFRVVAPYNAQVNLIRGRLVEAGYGQVRVGTVDKFQGQEAPVVIVSMTASSQGDVPRGMGFLFSRNRVNVAVSRARWLAVLIGSDNLTSYMPATAQGLRELGSFIGLCEATSRSEPPDRTRT